MFEGDEKNINELIDNLETLKKLDKKTMKYYTRQDSRQASNYEININEYGFYSNYGIKDDDILKHSAAYLKEKMLNIL